MIRIIRQSKSLIFRIALLAIALLAIGAGLIATQASPTQPDGFGTAATASDVMAMSRHHPIEFESPRYPNGRDSPPTRVAQLHCPNTGTFCGVNNDACCSKQCTDCLENPHRCYCKGGEAPPPTTQGTVESIEGDVSIRVGDGDWTDAVKGQKLTTGAEIHTGPGSKAVIRFSDGSFLVVRQLSETGIGEPSSAADRPKIRVLLKMGQASDSEIETANQRAWDTAQKAGSLAALKYLGLIPRDALQHTADGLRVPITTSRSRNAACRQFRRDLPGRRALRHPGAGITTSALRPLLHKCAYRSRISVRF